MQKYLRPLVHLALNHASPLSFANAQYTLDLTQCQDTGNGGGGDGSDKPHFAVNNGSSAQFEQCVAPDQLPSVGSSLLTLTCAETGDTVYHFNFAGQSAGTNVSCDSGKSDFVIQLSVDPSLPQTCTVHNVFSFIDDAEICN